MEPQELLELSLRLPCWRENMHSQLFGYPVYPCIKQEKMASSLRVCYFPYLCTQIVRTSRGCVWHYCTLLEVEALVVLLDLVPNARICYLQRNVGFCRISTATCKLTGRHSQHTLHSVHPIASYACSLRSRHHVATLCLPFENCHTATFVPSHSCSYCNM